MTTKTTVFAFRIDPKDAAELRRLAKDDHVSMAALVSQVLKSYLEWDHMWSKVGMVPMEKETVRELIENIPDDRMGKVVTYAADRFMGNLLLMTGKSTLESFLHVTRKRFEKSGLYLSEFVEDGKLQLTVHHRLGRKWSIFTSEYHDIAIRQLGYKTEVDVKDDLWIIKIETT
ncbi:hypothetical protein [Candidatus Nitrososphaera sp. FF02]|uniref:hypothetical protein n=1 Tax=Candidatus Nitrososphaera sp. FF02 TaxID=3398226 RepID=UPI0039EAB0F9